MNYIYAVDTSDCLSHHGIKGQKWGIRRYQNPDGSLTEAGRKKYGAGRTDKGSFTYDRKHNNAYNKLANRYDKAVKKANKTQSSIDKRAAALEKKAMNKTLKELGMSKNEIAYQKAGREYTKYLNGNPVFHTLFGGSAYTLYRASTQEGRRLAKNFNAADKAYRREYE